MYLIPKSAYFRLMEVMNEDELDDLANKNETNKNFLEEQISYKEGPSFRGPGKKQSASKLLSSLLKNSTDRESSTTSTTLKPSFNADPILSPPPTRKAASTPIGEWKNSPIKKALEKPVKGKRVCPLCKSQQVSSARLFKHLVTEHIHDIAIRNHLDELSRYANEEPFEFPSFVKTPANRKPPWNQESPSSPTPPPLSPAKRKVPSSEGASPSLKAAAQPSGESQQKKKKDDDNDDDQLAYFGKFKPVQRTPVQKKGKGRILSYDNTPMAKKLLKLYR